MKVLTDLLADHVLNKLLESDNPDPKLENLARELTENGEKFDVTLKSVTLEIHRAVETLRSFTKLLEQNKDFLIAVVAAHQLEREWLEGGT